MKVSMHVLALLSLVTIIGGRAQGGQLQSATALSTDIDLKTIAAMWEKYSDLIRTGDVEVLMTLFAFDAVFMEPGQPAISGKAAIRSVFEGALKAFTVDSMTISSAETQVAGDWAFDWGNITETVSRVGMDQKIQVSGNYLAILRREAGPANLEPQSWKIARLMVNSNTPPTAGGG